SPINRYAVAWRRYTPLECEDIAPVAVRIDVDRHGTAGGAYRPRVTDRLANVTSWLVRGLGRMARNTESLAHMVNWPTLRVPRSSRTPVVTAVMVWPAAISARAFCALRPRPVRMRTKNGATLSKHTAKQPRKTAATRENRAKNAADDGVGMCVLLLLFIGGWTARVQRMER